MTPEQELEALKKELAELKEAHARLVEIYKNHCATLRTIREAIEKS